MTPLQTKTIQWLAQDETGASSEAMAFWIAFDQAVPDRGAYPHDPADLDRCLRLLDAVPEMRPLLGKMASVSPVWAALIAQWEPIVRLHLDEVGLGWSKARNAPRTYDLMRKVIEPAMGQR